MLNNLALSRAQLIYFEQQIIEYILNTSCIKEYYIWIVDKIVLKIQKKKYYYFKAQIILKSCHSSNTELKISYKYYHTII